MRLATSVWPRRLSRGICQVGLLDASFPVGGQDDPKRVAAAKGGRIAQAVGNWQVARDQARAAERRAEGAGGEFPPYYEHGHPAEEFELMRQEITPWEADYSTEGP